MVDVVLKCCCSSALHLSGSAPLAPFLRQLITRLTGERLRWTADVERLMQQREKLSGDCLVGASFLSYLGAFTAEYRVVSLLLTAT